MLTYQDFCFLLNLLSTPRRYMDIAFHCFDVSADGNVEAKVVISKSNWKHIRNYIYINVKALPNSCCLNSNFSFALQEFVHVMASVTNYKQNPDELMEDTHSGLVNYLFGKDRKKEINRKTMHELQQKLMDDVLWLEFTRYSKDGKTISEVDFCTHLLLCANITSKKKKKMV